MARQDTAGAGMGIEMNEQLTHSMGRLAAHLTAGDLDHTLQRITVAAVQVLPGVDFASITVLHADGSLGTAAPTDPFLLELDAAQYEYREGPCYDAAVDQAYVTSPHLAADARYPRYAVHALSKGIKAQAAIRLFETPEPVARGALNLYARDVGSFEDMSILSTLFAHQSAVALSYAREVENLQEAVRTRQAIGRAVGIAMERYHLTEQRAFAFLARISQTRNVKMRDIAAELVAETEAGLDANANGGL